MSRTQDSIGGLLRGTVAIVDGQLCVNDRPIVVAGANVHEMHPTRGKAITTDDMLKDIEMLLLDCTMWD